MKFNINLLVGVIAGLAVGAGIGISLSGSGTSGDMAASSDEKKPLYWVAPMDPNYRRDEPGLSPMGMELIPVYEEGSSEGGEGPGTIRVSPDVVNNLGVRTQAVKMAALHSAIRTVGYVGYNEDKLIHIHPRVEGWIETLHVKAAGEPVKKGQPLYEFYSPQLVNAQEELMLSLSRNNQQLISAAEERLKALQLTNRFIQTLKRDRKVRQTVTFYAPQSGVIDNLNIREGFFVKPDKTLMSIGALEDVWVEAEVFERQAFNVKTGLPVTMTLDYLPGREWQGEVDYVYPSLDEKTRTLRVRLRFKNEDLALKPNMFAQVVIHANGNENNLLIPREAVIRTGDQNRVVLAIGDGQFKSIAVKLGQYDDQHVQVLEGLSENERVVTSAQFLLDSESSKSSDFMRLNHGDEENAKPEKVWVLATINSKMTDHKWVNVSHDPIPEWDWPEMKMDFGVADSVDYSQLKEQQSLHIEITDKGDHEFEITGIHIMDMPGMDQSDMNMSEMKMEDSGLMEKTDAVDHSKMDHSQMNQGEMDHSQMDHSKHVMGGAE